VNQTQNDWQKRYQSLAQAVPELEKKILTLEKTILVLESQKAQWEIEKVNQKVIIQQALNRSNSDTNQYLLENQQLRARIKELEALQKV
jgi:CRISPR/Cas system CMR-associated protein Cmr5 small subunit